MCGRFTLNTTGAELTHQFQLLRELEWQPRFNIAPTQLAPIVLAGQGGNEGQLAMWGLVPFWAKDLSAAARMINARSETVAEKPSFRQAYRKRRCLVPASGFFEWQAQAGGKVPWYFHSAQGQPFCFAGLWESWQDPNAAVDSAPIQSFTILTRAAHGDMAGIHARMPLILPRESEQIWLNADQAELRVPAPRPEGSLQHHRVSTRVNRPSHDDLDCIQAIAHDDRLF
jgi:putative SOS response-associated peptidase YedK